MILPVVSQYCQQKQFQTKITTLFGIFEKHSNVLLNQSAVRMNWLNLNVSLINSDLLPPGGVNFTDFQRFMF